MLRPSRPMMRPFMSSDGSWTTETVVSAAWLAARRCIATERIERTRRSASRLVSSSTWRMIRAESWRAWSSTSLSSALLGLAGAQARRRARARDVCSSRSLSSSPRARRSSCAARVVELALARARAPRCAGRASARATASASALRDELLLALAQLPVAGSRGASGARRRPRRRRAAVRRRAAATIPPARTTAAITSSIAVSPLRRPRWRGAARLSPVSWSDGPAAASGAIERAWQAARRPRFSGAAWVEVGSDGRAGPVGVVTDVASV